MSVIVKEESRSERRRRRTREALVDAALSLITANNIDNFTIQHVADSADVALATVYNYFESKEELISAAIERVMRRLAEKIEETVERFPDPARAFPYGYMSMLTAMTFDERFLWLQQRPAALARSLDRCFSAYCKNDIRQAVVAGRYQVADLDTVWRMVSWSAVGVSLGVSHGELPREALTTTTINFIVMLGLSQKEAVELVTQLPALPVLD